MPSPADNRLDLLLAVADEGKPALEDGIPNDAVSSARKPKGTRDDIHKWPIKGADPNTLPLQKWGVVINDGAEGEGQLEAIRELFELRRDEQGCPPMIYRVKANMRLKDAIQWKDDVYGADDVHPEDRPRYLVMLGDLHHTSLELQHTLANTALVGRVHFAGPDGSTDLAGYKAYASKVARYARAGAGEAPASPDLLFHVAGDGSEATTIGRTRLVDPSLEVAEQERVKGRLEVSSAREVAAETVAELLEAGKSARSSVLLTVSHGLGAPRRGPWKSEEEMWRRQGAMVLRYDEILDAERLRGQPFLPGGMWFYLACFGAGTPSTSVYAPWLAELASADAFRGSLAAVRKSLPVEGQRPFVAMLPQVALANEAGPLAVIGHMDLAWTYSFSGAKRLSESRKTRVLTVLEEMARGSRAGVALDTLTDCYQQANNALMSDYEAEKGARDDQRPDPTDRVERAHLWMLRNDLRGYVLLGDPAVRLPLQKFPPVPKDAAPALVSAPASAPVSASVSGSAGVSTSAAASSTESTAIPADVKEAAVLAVLQGDEAPRAIAARARVTVPILWDWVFAYRAGGLERLNR